VILLSFGVYYRLNKVDDKSSEKKINAEKIVVKVKTIPLERKDLIMQINTQGKALAYRTATIVSNVFGVINNLNIHENSFVKENEQLFIIENRENQLSLEQAENELTLAKIEYGIRKNDNENSKKADKQLVENIENEISKIENDYKSNKITKKEYEEKILDLDVKKLFAKANKDEVLRYSSGLSSKLLNYKRAKLLYEYSFIKAPFQGYIADLKITNKEFVNANNICCSIYDISKIKIEIDILESEISSLKENRAVDIVFNAYPTLSFKGNIEYISPIINENSRTNKAIVYIDNSKNLIKPGMIGNVVIEGNIYKDRLLVPKEAVLTRDNRKLVFVAEGNKAKWVYVETKLENRDYVEIESKELKEGLKIIISNNYTLAHDANITEQ